MSSFLKYGALFVGGVALGALAMAAANKKGGMAGLGLKSIAADLVSRGMGLKESLMSKVEIAKENMEDLAAEARQAQEKRKAAAEAAEAVEK